MCLPVGVWGMSERTDEITSEDADDALHDDALGSDAGVGDVDDQVGFDDDLGVDVDALTGDVGGDASADRTAGAGGSESTTDAGPGLLSRLTPSFGRPELAPSLPSLRSFLLALVLVVGGMLVGSAVPFIGSVTGLVGLFAGAFLLGVGSGKRRYLPVAVAGGAAAVGATAMQGVLTLAFIQSVGVAPTAALGATTGVLVAVLGHYFGRDLRAGLTRDV